MSQNLLSENRQFHSPAAMSQISNEILKEVVVKDLGVEEKEVDILASSEEAGSSYGDGFACEVRRINIQASVSGEETSLVYIAKVVPEDMRGDFIRQVIDALDLPAPWGSLRVFFSVCRAPWPKLRWQLTKMFCQGCKS